jgi:hypothetical protein
MDLTVVTAERTVWFLGTTATTTALVAVGKAVAWSPWRRRSVTVRFPGEAVKSGLMTRFLVTVMAWRQSGWRRGRRGCGKF